MTETQPGREPQQGAGPENEAGEQIGQGTGYADASSQASLAAREPNDDLHGMADGAAESAEASGA